VTAGTRKGEGRRQEGGTAEGGEQTKERGTGGRRERGEEGDERRNLAPKIISKSRRLWGEMTKYR